MYTKGKEMNLALGPTLRDRSFGKSCSVNGAHLSCCHYKYDSVHFMGSDKEISVYLIVVTEFYFSGFVIT